MANGFSKYFSSDSSLGDYLANRDGQNQLTSLIRGSLANPSDLQPMNTIRTSSGEYLTPQGQRQATPYQFSSAPQVQQQMAQPRGFSTGNPYALPVDATGMVPIFADATEEDKKRIDEQLQKANAWEQQNAITQQKLKEGELDIAAKQAALKGESVKPVFDANAGGYIYPPSPENPQGKFVPVAGLTKPEKPLTEYQGQNVMYGTRAADAHNLLNSLEDKINTTSLKSAQALEGVPLAGMAAHAMLSPEAQRVDQAQRNFVNAVMRRESGATISSAEFENAKKQYFPQPGDDKATIEQKRRTREMVINGFARGAGPGSKDIMDVYQSNPYKSEQPQGKVSPHPQDLEAVAWAKANPNDPRAQKIMLANGY